MEVNGQLHGPAVLSRPRTLIQVRIWKHTQWTPELVCIWWWRESFLSLQGLEPRSSKPVTLLCATKI